MNLESPSALDLIQLPYQTLRVQASKLTLKKPQSMKMRQNWIHYVEDVFKKCETVIHLLLNGDPKKEAKQLVQILNYITAELNYKLMSVSKTIVREMPKDEQNDRKQVVQVKKFWMKSMGEFVHCLSNWIKDIVSNIVFREKGNPDEKKKCVHEVLEQGLDLLWGIYC